MGAMLDQGALEHVARWIFNFINIFNHEFGFAGVIGCIMGNCTYALL